MECKLDYFLLIKLNIILQSYSNLSHWTSVDVFSRIKFKMKTINSIFTIILPISMA